MGATTTDSLESGRKSNLLRLLALGRRYFPFYVALCVLALIASAGNTGIAELLRVIVNAAAHKDSTILMESTVVGIGLVALMALTQFASDYLSSVVDTRSVQHLQERLLQKIMQLPMRTLRDYHSADLFNRLNDSANVAQSGVNQQGVKLFRNIAQIVMLLGYLLYVSAPLAVGAIVLAIVLPIAMVPLSKRMGTLYGQRQLAQAAEQAFVQESVQGMEVVKSLSLWPTVGNMFVEKSDVRLQRHRRVLVGESILWRINMLVFIVGILYALGFGGYLVAQNKLDMGAIAGFLVAFMNMLGPIGEISALWPQFQNAVAQSKRVFEILDLPDDGGSGEQAYGESRSPGDVPSSLNLSFDEVVGADLHISDVSFRYQSDTAVLQSFNLRVAAGETTALVGPSGGGKSTLLQLLLRFYDPDVGHIYLGHHNLRTLSPQVWRQHVGFVPQETLVFAGTVYDNILCGRPDATRAQVLNAAEMARVDAFVRTLPHGFDTFIGERGLLLSGGERQRLALARAILRNPPVLLLDEPTSALDSENEALVQSAIDSAMQGRTTIVIAHRLSTIQHAHQIAFIRGGQVLELGTHQDLLNQRGAYFELHEAGHATTASDSKLEVR